MFSLAYVDEAIGHTIFNARFVDEVRHVGGDPASFLRDIVQAYTQTQEEMKSIVYVRPLNILRFEPYFFIITNYQWIFTKSISDVNSKVHKLFAIYDKITELRLL